MSDDLYLKRLFRVYYKEKRANLPLVNQMECREFGFIPWEKPIMIRHLGFDNANLLKNYLIKNTPKHMYSSGSLYLEPYNLKMDLKKYQGCDLIIDIDVDHFFTPCKDDHDIWYCKECGAKGKGMHKKKCPKCGQSKFRTLAWICEDCLDVAKKEILKLIYNFLIPDFDIKEEEMKVAFSGNRGYHLKIENKRIRTLSSEARREIVDYVTGHNISLDILGLNNLELNLYNIKENYGWTKKIIDKIDEIVTNYSNDVIINIFKKDHFKLNDDIIEYILNNKRDFLKTLWNINGLGKETWKRFLIGIVKEVGAEIDEPVTIDIHRLIRYPGSLHGKSGFKVQELALKDLESFNPLNETNEILDPIVFKSTNMQKIEIIEKTLPVTKIKDESFGPYAQGDIIEVPHHIAVFLLCKEVAKTL